MDPRMAWVGAMGIALACGGMSGPEERVDQSSSNANFRQGSYTSSTPSVDLFSACAPTKVSSLNEGVFVPNPWCTMPSTFDPTIGAPSAAALAQLAPTGVLRVGVYYGNFGLAVRDPNTGVLSGTAVDISCRLATQLYDPDGCG